MRLDDLLLDLAPAGTPLPEGKVRGLCYDSRKLSPGDLFVAIRGEHTDGHRYLAEAADKGAVAALVEEKTDANLPQIVVGNTLAVLSTVAARFYGHPSRHLTVVGVTGSNGKTTSCYLLESIGAATGESVGVLGTIEYRWAGQRKKAVHTTPMALELQQMLAQMRKDGVQMVAMEASSHALALHRLDDVEFTGALFTNLSPEHLDFHKDMDNYGRTKLRLFTELLRPDGVAVVNGDDAWGRTIAEALPQRECFVYGRKDADLFPGPVKMSREGLVFQFNAPDGSITLESRLLGTHNLYNILGAAGMAWALGYPLEAIAEGVAALETVPGRLERVDAGQDFLAVVDYAHTPDGLLQVLETLSGLPHKRIITVMGCGGDRDRTKRPKMGAIALRLSQVTIVTSDNPRSEDPLAIIDEIVAGMSAGEKGKDYHVVPEREDAIRQAVGLAEAGDIVLVAGKGHETTQTIGANVLPFDDREVLGRALREAR
ncbi:UDP-N-acetylmuramoyl-L-alanyl-D-glutamate--2,6-diaminopimelate ligase [bacterium]|nr:UDP-N-acetylmuramoyl-L-alanyl-D-glutamate--2,6-diaminopimelate ligase [bacterium]